ncbi:uncharacterized protein [Venturia canescens]|uniref:uncharacterized protein n=1 Tax=Venturia canescens TaxID=32260 RepID=UPI001C9CB49A|nr:uncharacterized protein LOC122409275 [Venturia canescens]
MEIPCEDRRENSINLPQKECTPLIPPAEEMPTGEASGTAPPKNSKEDEIKSNSKMDEDEAPSSKKKKKEPKFQQSWLKNPQLTEWLKENPDTGKSKCTYCKVELSNDLTNLKQHANREKHKKLARQNLTINDILHAASSSKYDSKRISPCGSPQKSDLHNLKKETEKYDSIKKILFSHFQKDLQLDIQDGKFSLLLDVSNDLPITKLLGMGIVYYSTQHKKIVSTFFALRKLEAHNAKSIVGAIKKSIEESDLKLEQLMAIGIDNSESMAPLNKDVYGRLKSSLKSVSSLIFIKYTCRSLEHALSSAISESLPRCLEFCIYQTYNWFSKPGLGMKYSEEYAAIDCDEEPFKILEFSNIKWLSNESALTQILNNWSTLEKHFESARNNERCYLAEQLYRVFNDESNKLYFHALKHILSKIKKVDESFRSENNDRVKIFGDLMTLSKEIAPKRTTLHGGEDSSTHSADDTEIGLGDEFEQQADRFRKDKKNYSLSDIRNRCHNFLENLSKRLVRRLPRDTLIFKQMELLSVDNVLKTEEKLLKPLISYCGHAKNNAAIESQLKKIHLNKDYWTNKTDTVAFWHEVNMHRDDESGKNPYQELADLALSVLVLPHPDAQTDRLLHRLNIMKKTWLDEDSVKMINMELTIDFGLERNGKCVHDYDLPSEILADIHMTQKHLKD